MARKKSLQKLPDYMPLNTYVETYCTFDTDLISEVSSLG